VRHTQTDTHSLRETHTETLTYTERDSDQADRFRCQVVVSKSVAEGIINWAAQEGVDLIAMYTRDRKGLVRLIKGSIAAQVERASSTEVRVFRPRELAEAGGQL